MRLPLLALTALLASALAVPQVAGAQAPGDRYIVVLRSGEDSGQVARQHRARHGAQTRHVYRHALNGYSARIAPGELGAIRSDRRVAWVERDGVVRKSATQTQTGAPWGLDRIDQRALPLSGTFSYANTGAGVNAHILDTGIRATHQEFGGRVATADGFTAINDGRGTSDCDGHGTHVAGTVGGGTYGVAKGVTLVPVRVLDCNGSGTWSGVIAGVDHVTARAALTAGPDVANMSLGGGANSSVDAAVRNSISSGVQYTIAAGNGNAGGKEQDACNSSPARVMEAITISATNSSDQKASWANYGNCVDFFAPGVGITSAVHSSNTATATWSGTSMAAPHAAGAAALYLQSHAGATAQALRDALYGLTTKDVVLNSRTANRHLLFFDATSADAGTGGDGGDGGTIEDPPAQDDPTGDPVSLSVSAYKVKGVQHADLRWSGATGGKVDVFRDGAKIATVSNSGSYTDNIGNKGGGSYRYRVCEEGTSTCSAEQTASF